MTDETNSLGLIGGCTAFFKPHGTDAVHLCQLGYTHPGPHWCPDCDEFWWVTVSEATP